MGEVGLYFQDSWCWVVDPPYLAGNRVVGGRLLFITAGYLVCSRMPPRDLRGEFDLNLGKLRERRLVYDVRP